MIGPRRIRRAGLPGVLDHMTGALFGGRKFDRSNERLNNGPMSAPTHLSFELEHGLNATLAVVGKAVASPQRIDLLDHLVQAPRSVEELARLAGLSVANTSAHLKVLREAHVVATARTGKQVIYRVANDDVVRFLVALRSLSAQVRPEMAHAIHLREERVGPSLSFHLAREALREGRLWIVDVRPEQEFSSGHLPSARSVPVDELSTYLDGFGRSRRIAVYGRGPGCERSILAVRTLRRHGYDAVLLEGGVAEWIARGFVLER